MNTAPNRAARLCAISSLLLTAAACQGPDATINSSSADSPTNAPLSAAQTRALNDLSQSLRRPSKGLLVTSDAQGGMTADLQGGFQHAVMVEKNADGSYTFVCTDSADTATEFFTRTTAPKANE
jgi:hypothetical protein